MSFTAADVKELRERTGAGMMDCKKALVESDGDMTRAIEWLQVKGIAKAAKKADRVTAEGLVAVCIADDARSGVMVEVNSETDFVARNDEFVNFVNELARHILTTDATTVEALMATTLGGQTVEELRNTKVASIGENITIRRFERLHAPEGFVAGYVHGGGAKAALLSFQLQGADVSDELRDMGRNLAMHTVASAPRFLSDADVDPTAIENEKRLLLEKAAESGKPAEVVEKMVVGQIAKWKKEICLLDQPFVMDPDVTVLKYVANTTGGKGAVRAFSIYNRGEGIEKQSGNFADEVAAMTR
jgi:elongation factor Ts